MLKNVASPRGNWLALRVLERSGRDALGATVRLMAGTRKLRRDVRAAASYASSVDPRVHVGLGDVAVTPAVTVRWPDGAEESWSTVAIDTWTTLRQGTGR